MADKDYPTQTAKAETWKRHPVHGNYEVSDAGRVRRCVAYSSTSVGKILRPGKDKDGYRRVSLCEAGKSIAYKKVHVLVLETFVGLAPPGHCGCHNDGDNTNNALVNLRWDTMKGNHADRERHGHTAIGSRHGQSKLTEEQVLEIRSTHKRYVVTRRFLAEKFGVNQSIIDDVITRETWRHV